jgi:phosphoadenosine phosphosulfate reductase
VISSSEVESLNEQFKSLPTAEVLAWVWDRFGERASIGTAFQGAGLVMMDLAREQGLRFPVFTLDTGLLFPETLELKKRLEAFFGCQIETLVPDLSVEQQGAAHGPKLWKRDPDLCCSIRKVLPLRNKLSEIDAWITGLRRQQSDKRAETDIVEIYLFDETTGREIVKINPMANWSREDVWKYVRDHKIPYNPLHDQGYRSIGCWPCTSATGAGDDERAGRWTGFSKTECGIHTFMARRSKV